MKLIITACLLIIACTASAHNVRIIGGTTAKLGDVPHIVSVRLYNEHFCGGTIISQKFIVTAAHCFFRQVSDIKAWSVQYGVVQAGKKEPNVIQAKNITLHPKYVHRGGFYNDIALVELETDIVFGPNVKAARLPTPFEETDRTSPALLAGWGLIKPGGDIVPDLRKVFITIYSDQVCQTIEPKDYDSDLHLCAGLLAGGKGQCSGDSGGPLTVDGKLYGIVSWSQKPCASPNHPGVFTKVTAHRNWIRLISRV